VLRLKLAEVKIKNAVKFLVNTPVMPVMFAEVVKEIPAHVESKNLLI
jgi:hypothetical protein